MKTRSERYVILAVFAAIAGVFAYGEWISDDHDVGSPVCLIFGLLFLGIVYAYVLFQALKWRRLRSEEKSDKSSDL